MKIRNINGTSDTDCSCESWLKYRKWFSGQKIEYCQANGFLKKDLVGAHEQKDGGAQIRSRLAIRFAEITTSIKANFMSLIRTSWFQRTRAIPVDNIGG